MNIINKLKHISALTLWIVLVGFYAGPILAGPIPGLCYSFNQKCDYNGSVVSCNFNVAITPGSKIYDLLSPQISPGYNSCCSKFGGKAWVTNSPNEITEVIQMGNFKFYITSTSTALVSLEWHTSCWTGN